MPVHTRWHAVLAKPRCLPTPCASPCSLSRQAAEASCPTAVHPFVHTLFPSACGQRVGASARAGAVPAAAVCPGSDPGLPSLSRSCEPLEKRDDQRPCLAPERFPRDTWLRHSQQTSLHGTEAAGSFGRAGRGPTPPSSMAAPSGTPPRRGLRGVQSTTGLHTSGRKIHLSAQPPADQSVQRLRRRHTGCPHYLLDCQAIFSPPIGAATRSNRRGALPHLHAPQGLGGKHWRRCALPGPLVPVTPHPPHEGMPRIAPAPEGARVCLVELAWAGVHPGGWAPPDPCQPKRIVIRMVFHWPGCVPRIRSRGRLPMAREASRVGAAREPLPWPASGRCGFPSLEGHAR